MTSYIVASSKPWHRKKFDDIFETLPGDWFYVSRPEELGEAINKSTPRYIFFLHWNWLVPKDIWARHECVCFHMTDLPYGRGGSPLQNLIVAGFQQTKLTALRMVEDLDAGPIYAKRSLSLEGRAEDIYLRAGETSWDMIRWIVDKEPETAPQEGEVTRFKRRKPEQSVLPRTGRLEKIYDHIRMLDAPTYPLAFIEHGEFRLEFSDAEILDGEIHGRVVLRHRQGESK